MSEDAMRKFLISLTIDKDVRDQFAADAEALMAKYGLSEPQKEAIRTSNRATLDKIFQSLQAGGGPG